MAIVQLKRTKHPNGSALRWIEAVAIPYEGDDCLIWPFHKNHLGRPVLKINYKTVYGCRVVCERVYGPPPAGAVAAHSCGMGHEGCISPHHLRWTTRKANSEEMIEHGRSTRGSTNPRSKLTEADVIDIRRAVAEGVGQRTLARTHDVSPSTINMIVKRRVWAWL